MHSITVETRHTTTVLLAVVTMASILWLFAEYGICDDGLGYFTVFWNGIIVQYHTASLGPMKHRAVATYDSRETTGPIMLQQHGSAVRFRNIWVRPLTLEP